MTDHLAEQVFVAYPAKDPLVAETMRNAAGLVEARSAVQCLPWEQMGDAGTVVVNRILEEIDRSRFVLAEISAMSPNVLFEVGYAIATCKHLLLAYDETDVSTERNWENVGLLRGIKYIEYGGSSERLAQRVIQAIPTLDGMPTIWNDLELQIKDPQHARSLFLYPSTFHRDDARAIDRLLNSRGDLSIARADEDERGYAPLSWYVNEIYKATAAIFHLLGPQRARSLVHNARGSLLAGIARGRERSILIVAERTYEPAFDYQDLAYLYGTAKALSERVNTWLDDLPTSSVGSGPTGKLHLRVELPISFGEYVAEAEQDELPDYFVETAEYKLVLESGNAVFVGRKGTGKTATMLLAANELALDKRVLVTVIYQGQLMALSLVMGRTSGRGLGSRSGRSRRCLRSSRCRG